MSSCMYIAGCGPGAPEYVTPAVSRAVQNADVLVGAQRLLDLFPGGEAERVPLAGDVEGVLETACRRWREGEQVCILVTGSPGLCSLASAVVRRVGRAHCRILPGVSSVQVACARLGADWQNIRVVNAHNGKPDEEVSASDAGPKTAIFLGRPESGRWAAQFIGRIRRPVRLFACEELTLPEEHVHEVDIDELKTLDFPSRTVLLVVEEGELS